MTMRSARLGRLCALVVALLVTCEARGAGAVSVDVGSADTVPGGEVSVAVTLRSMGSQVVAVQNRIAFDPSLAIASKGDGMPDCTVDAGIDKPATAFRFLPVGCAPGTDCTGMRAVVLAFDNLLPIPDGAVLYTCRVQVRDSAAPGDYPLGNAELAAADANGHDLPVAGHDGVVHVHSPEVAIDLTAGNAPAGGGFEVAATLRAIGVQVAGAQNRIDFAAPLDIAARADGSPDCTVNPTIDKHASAFHFLPVGCAPGSDCAAVSAVILAFDNVDPIPSGSTLYTCRASVAADAAPGRYLLRNSEISAAGPAGELLPANGSDAAVEVADATALAISIGSVRAIAGQRVSVPVTLEILDSSGAGVAGTQNQIAFDPQARIAATAEGTPDCAVNPDLDKNGTAFLFLPPGCAPGVDCAEVRAVVLALDNTAPIADGATLYDCSVQVGSSAAVGTYPLRNGDAAGGNAAGAELTAFARDGAVTVICAGDCDGDGRVAIFELLRGVNMSLSNAPLSTCPVFDADGSGAVAINEIVQAVGSALGGCTLPD